MKTVRKGITVLKINQSAQGKVKENFIVAVAQSDNSYNQLFTTTFLHVAVAKAKNMSQALGLDILNTSDLSAWGWNEQPATGETDNTLLTVG